MKLENRITSRLRKALDQTGVSQRELAERMGVSPPVVNRMLWGNPTLGSVVRICEAVGIELEVEFVVNR